MKKNFLLLLLMILSSVWVSAQRDTDHWIAPYYDSSLSPYIHSLYFSTDSITPFEVKIYTNNTQIGSVSISKGSPKVFTVAAGYIKNNAVSEAAVVSAKGIYTKGDKPYFMTMRIASGSHGEIITSKGKAGIGNHFFAAASPASSLSNYNNFTTGILATENNTTVKISGYNPGVRFVNTSSTPSSFNVVLNKGQSYTLAGIANLAANKDGFIGAEIIADKPVSVTNGNSNGFYATSSVADGSDLIMDQSVPTERLGNQFAMVKSGSTSPYNMDGGIVVATENNTQIFLNNSSAPIATINAGQYYRILANAYVNQGGGHFNMYVRTSKNVYLYQLVGVGSAGNTGGYNLIPPLDCFLPRKMDEIGRINEMPGIASVSVRLNILTQTGATVQVNGVSPTSAQGPYAVQGTTDWVTYSIPNVSGNTTITSDRAVTAGINGGYSTAGYGGYFAGFSSVPVIVKKSGDCMPGIVLEVDDSYDTYQWYVNGVLIPGANSNEYTPVQSGNYTVRITVGQCAPKLTAVYKVYSCLVETQKDDNLCGDNLTINPQFSHSSQTPVPGTVTIITPPSHGTAVVDPITGTIVYTPSSGYVGTETIVYKFCGDDPEFTDCEQVTLHLNVSKTPVVQNAALHLCSDTDTGTFDLTSAQSAISSAPGATFTYYESLADAGMGNSNFITNPGSYLSQDKTIYVRVAVGVCSSIAELHLNVHPNPVVQNSGLSICSDSTTGVFNLIAAEGAVSTTPGAVFTYYESLSDANAGNANVIGNPSAYLSGTKTVYVRVSVGDCFSIAELALVVHPNPVVHNSSLSICSGTTIGIFDLKAAENSISPTSGVSFTYYETLTDATAGNANGIANPSVYSSSDKTIYVRVSLGPCFSIAELVLKVNSTPVVHDSGLSLCSDTATGTFDLTSAEGAISTTSGAVFSYFESLADATAGTTGAIINPTAYVSIGKTIYVRVSVGECFSIAELILTVHPNPVVQNAGLSLCSDTATAVFDLTTAEGAISSTSGAVFTYFESLSDANAGNTGAIATPSAYLSSSKTVYVRVSLGECFSIAELELKVNANPVVHNTSLSLCSDTTTAIFDLTSAQGAISVTPGIIFKYYENSADANAGNNNFIPNPTVFSSASTMVYVRVESATCYSIATLKLVVNVKPVATITASSMVICHDIPVTLTSNFPTGNTWSTGETTQSISVSAGGVYSLINYNGLCESNEVSVTILKDENPNLQINGNLTFCEGDSTVLTATASGNGNTFVWSNGTNGNILTVTAPGTYSVTVTTPLGCQYDESVTVNMDPLIVVNIIQPAEAITCLVTSLVLDATGSVYQPGATFQWTATGGGNILSGGDTLTPTVDKGGVYTLTIYSATPMGCVKQSSVTVLEDTVPPSVTLTASELIICKGSSVVLTASGALTYSWAGLPSGGNSQTVSPETTTTYTVTGTGENGCVAQATLTITVVPAIESSLHNIIICEGQKGMLDAGAGPNYSYIWSTGEITRTINVTVPGTYTVTISNGVCSKVYSAQVNFTKVPDVLDVIYEKDNLKIIVKNNENIPLEFSIDGGVTWQESNIFYNVHKNTEYEIRVRNIRTLCDAYVNYYTFFMPNTITPNGDGYNDVISFEGVSKLNNFSATIFDRYGMQIFKATPQNAVWDGKFLARVIPTATYWYIVSWQNRVTGKLIKKSGWILLKNRNDDERRNYIRN